jgi:uncharacterized protein (DUF2147 family)
MKKMFKLGAILFSVCFVCSAFAKGPIVGKWKTIDDETNEPKSIVEIFEKDGKFYGKIVELFLKKDADQNPTCDECDNDDPRKDQPTLGMEIIKGLQVNGDSYSYGKILDPKNGKVYKCKITREDDTLKMQGSFLFFSRTQTWHLVK